MDAYFKAFAYKAWEEYRISQEKMYDAVRLAQDKHFKNLVNILPMGFGLAIEVAPNGPLLYTFTDSDGSLFPDRFALPDDVAEFVAKFVRSHDDEVMIDEDGAYTPPLL